MSALSFREQAAIAFATTPIYPGWNQVLDLRAQGVPTDPVRRPENEAIEMASCLADACCEAWGHDYEATFPAQIGAATIASPDRPPQHRVCRRCGAKP